MSLPTSTARPARGGLSSKIAGLKFMQRAATRQPSAPALADSKATTAPEAATPDASSSQPSLSAAAEEWVLPSAAEAIARARARYASKQAQAVVEYDDHWRSWELDSEEDEAGPSTSPSAGQKGRNRFGEPKEESRGDRGGGLEPKLESDSDLGSDQGANSDGDATSPPPAKLQKPRLSGSLGTARAPKGQAPPTARRSKRPSDPSDAAKPSTARNGRAGHNNESFERLSIASV